MRSRPRRRGLGRPRAPGRAGGPSASTHQPGSRRRARASRGVSPGSAGAFVAYEIASRAAPASSGAISAWARASGPARRPISPSCPPSANGFCGSVGGYAQVFGSEPSDRIRLEGSTFGAARNPYDRTRIPGASSGGVEAVSQLVAHLPADLPAAPLSDRAPLYDRPRTAPIPVGSAGWERLPFLRSHLAELLEKGG